MRWTAIQKEQKRMQEKEIRSGRSILNSGPSVRVRGQIRAMAAKGKKDIDKGSQVV